MLCSEATWRTHGRSHECTHSLANTFGCLYMLKMVSTINTVDTDVVMQIASCAREHGVRMNVKQYKTLPVCLSV